MWHVQLVRAGLVSITLNSDFFAPKDPSNPAHVEAAERAQQFSLGWFANPVYKDGDYPQVRGRARGEKFLHDARGHLQQIVK